MVVPDNVRPGPLVAPEVRLIREVDALPMAPRSEMVLFAFVVRFMVTPKRVALLCTDMPVRPPLAAEFRLIVEVAFVPTLPMILILLVAIVVI